MHNTYPAKFLRDTWFSLLTLAAMTLPATTAAAARTEDHVSLPAAQWEAMLDRVAAEDLPAPTLLPFSQISRTIEGEFKKGLFSATLRSRFEVFARDGHTRVPVLDGAASVGEVVVNGRTTSLLREGAMYTMGVDAPGVYDLRVRFFWGHEQDRFARRLRFSLPAAGVTRLQIALPEKGIDATLAGGALESVRATSGGTVLVGYLDGHGEVNLAWKRQLSHSAASHVRTESRTYALLSVGESLVSGISAFDFRIVEGETDRLDLTLPDELEVLRVEGDAVLQWYTDAQDDQKLVVLLRYLVDDRTRISVHFQHPVEAQGVAVPLRMPGSAELVSGFVGLQAPAGIDVKVAQSVDARPLSLRDLPPELADLSSVPLLTGFEFEKIPQISVRIGRHQSVDLTSTVVDEMQASTVLIEDGTEITKLKLRLRNNTRQYLAMTLPPGAVLTTSRLDGDPVRPAIGSPESKGHGESLLFPLRQSERIGAGYQRSHVVQPGETLTGIANYYYSDPGLWRRVADENSDTLYTGSELQVGQRLRIPARNATVEESTFVLELAYKRQLDPLSHVGNRRVTLPGLDIDTVKVTWHLYFPHALTPLSFASNLQQFSSIRYDPVRRLLQFLRDAVYTRDAWAGGQYRSILSKRKSIFQQEARNKRNRDDVVGNFPLVGERYRFKRLLLGQQQPEIAVRYASASYMAPARWLAFFAALVLGLMAFTARKKREWITLLVGLCLLAVAGHYVLGIHRRVLWALDLALLITVLRYRGGPWIRAATHRLHHPWTVRELLSLRSVFKMMMLCAVVGVLLLFPLLLSSFGIAALLVLWWKGEKAHV